MTFLHINSEITFGTSRKVMSTFFEQHQGFAADKFDYVDYFVCRNPYARAVSLWADKCRLNWVGQFQHNQKIIAGASHRNESQLASLSFLEFCRLLPNLRDLNDHFRPQTWGVPGFFRTLLKIESMETFPPLKSVDWTEKTNASVHRDSGEYLCPESTDIIRKVYQFDFQILGYPL